jgi:hypothetical protein
MGRQMTEIEYYVALFHHEGDRLVGQAPIKADSTVAAIGEAQHRAQEVGGAIVFGCSRSGEDEELEILFRTGDVPDGVPEFFADRSPT